jgi:hypothetical protein
MSVQNGVVEVQTSDLVLFLLDASDGRERFHVQLASESVFTQIDGDMLYLLPSAGSSVTQNIQAFRLSDGKAWDVESTRRPAILIAEAGDGDILTGSYAKSHLRISTRKPLDAIFCQGVAPFLCVRLGGCCHRLLT